MSKKQAAAYAGCETLSAFNDWIRRGIMPGPIPGTHKWDRKAIDAALDRLSGLQPTIEPQLSPYDEWKVSENRQRVKEYRLTAQGKKQLASERSRWKQVMEAMAGILNPSPGEGKA